MMIGKPHFELSEIREGVSSDPPMVVQLLDLPDEVGMSRRGFVGLSFATAAAAVLSGSGCGPRKPEHTLTLGAERARIRRAKDYSFSPSVKRAHANKIVSLGFSPDRRFLATACLGDNHGSHKAAGSIKLWNVGTGALQKTILADTTRIEFTGSGSRIVAQCTDHKIRVFGIPGGELVNCFESDTFFFVSRQSDVVALQGKTTSIWDCSGSPRQKAKLTDVKTVAVSPLGSFAAYVTNTASTGSDVHCVTVHTSADVSLQSDDSVVHALAGSPHPELGFSPDERILALRVLDKVVFWNLADLTLIKTKSQEAGEDATYLYSEAGKPEHLLNEDGLPLGYTMEDFFPLAEHYSDSGTETPTALSADSKLVAVGNSHGQVSLFTFPKSGLWKTISDPSLGTVGTKADGKNIYTRRDELGHIRTFTQPCGSPLPPGTTCTCDCVPTAAPASTSSDWTTTCSCNTVCTCVPVYR